MGENGKNMDTSGMTLIIAELANTNYYNEHQNLVRVKIGKDLDEKYYDFGLIDKYQVPNPVKHYALVWMEKRYLNINSNSILPGDDRLNYLPGYKSDGNLYNEFPFGFVMLVDRRIKSNTTNVNVSQVGNFNNGVNVASDMQNVQFSLSPSLNKDYTTTKGDLKSDIKNENIGIFITDNAVHIKSRGASIILGPDGISLLGDRTETATTGSFGIMQRNAIGTLLPTTLLTFPATIEYIPNIDMILSIGNTVKRVAAVSAAVGKVTNIMSNVGG